MTRRGPFDVIVDLAGGDGVERRWRQQFLHIRPGGAHVTRLRFGDPTAGWLEQLQDLRNSGALEPPRHQDPRERKARTEHALAEALVSWYVLNGYAVTVNGTPALAKLRDLATDEFLGARPELGEVLRVIPGEQFAPRGTVRHSETDSPPRVPSVYDAPPLALRAYRDVECRHRQGVWQSHVVLPDSFRHNAKPVLRSPAFVDLTTRFVRRPKPSNVRLEGVYYHLDSAWRGHFGHALSEQVSRMWGWAEAKRLYPGLKALVFASPGRPVAEWEFDLFEAAGIQRHEVHVAHDPVRVETLVGASPMFSMPDFIHPAIEETYRQISNAFAERSSVRSSPSRIFCSRRGRRTCHNPGEVEGRFRAAGFEIVYPEDLRLADQIALVRNADVIGGYAGSGMFQTAFTVTPKHVILVGSESYTAVNEYMMAAVIGHRIDAILARADVAVGNRFSVDAYHSPFSFDPDREGRFLEQVLVELPAKP